MKHRSAAEKLIAEGAIRLNRTKVAKASQSVKPDDILTVALHGDVRVVKVRGEATHRGSAVVAATLYENMEPC